MCLVNKWFPTSFKTIILGKSRENTILTFMKIDLFSFTQGRGHGLNEADPF